MGPPALMRQKIKQVSSVGVGENLQDDQRRLASGKSKDPYRASARSSMRRQVEGAPYFIRTKIKPVLPMIT